MARTIAPLIFLLFVPLASFLSAQETLAEEAAYEDTDPTTDPAFRARLDKITAKLQLTEAQIPEVAAILKEFTATAATNPPTTPEAKRAQRRTLRSRVMRLLSPEQRALVQAGRGRANASPHQASKKAGPQPQKRGWFDVLLDDIAAPLLNNRRGKR
ncbi:MAG: hypothetical protein AAGF89_10105, partial [Bacteroidota bacterium]